MRILWTLACRPKVPGIRHVGTCTSRDWLLRARAPFSTNNRLQQQASPDHLNDHASKTQNQQSFDRSAFEGSVKKNLFYIPSFQIYHGLGTTETRGLFDYGPLGTALQTNIINLWRKHFVLEEDMLEIDCTSLTPYDVLKSSGHVDRFTDWVCRDPSTGESFRADHLIKDTLLNRFNTSKSTKSQAKDQRVLSAEVQQEYQSIVDSIDSLDGEALGNIIQKHDVTSPTSGKAVEKPVPFNLMFQTNIGSGLPSKALNSSVFLRPETAQGQFVNFDLLFKYNQQSLPFASASVGKCYRNEISPRAGLLRTREFLLAEIEHFLDPAAGKRHRRFNEISSMELDLLDRESQANGSYHAQPVSVESAVSNGIIDSETLGYFLARTQQFLITCGIDSNRLRFRQHGRNEMAHYATDCWDAEVHTSYGWIECVGCADRAAYDLTQHSDRTGQPLLASEILKEPKYVETFQINIDYQKFGPHFKRDSKAIETALSSISQTDLQRLASQLEAIKSIDLEIPAADGSNLSRTVQVPKDMVSVTKVESVEHVRRFVPNVIEPSFGIGRILYALLEHAWTAAEDGRTVLSMTPMIAPIKVLLASVVTASPELLLMTNQLDLQLKRLGIHCKFDQSGTSIGKKYLRADEMGIPLALTVDSQSIEENTFTLRYRDTKEQVRGNRSAIFQAITGLVSGEEDWTSVSARLPLYGPGGDSG